MEILASLDDINAHLSLNEDEPIIEATDENSDLVQISIARVIRGYLRGVIENTQLLLWNTPEETPETIREIAGMLIASRVYFNAVNAQTLEISDDNFAQRKYNEAMAMLNQIVEGTIVIPDVIVSSEGLLSELDFFPVDDTDRAFTMGMEL